MDSIEGITVGRLLLAEYDRVKEEQKTRIGFRDNLIYVTLAAVVTVLIGMTQTHRLTLLLVLPFATSVLGWTYLANDEKISAIGRYVRTDLGPRLGELAGDRGYMFEWELAHRSDVRRRQRKILQCMVDLIIFCVLPLVALAAFWCGASAAPLAVVISVLEALAVVVLGAQIVLYAEIAA
ncbi:MULTISPECIES: hypothetical protein [unclassified Streptomyces]|uniref:hypothetical protein n=1 Tax=unclassified Streptomyces TaxID=2593676 RepID=UPI0031F90A71